ncbi:hypothetical protein AVEN_231468-1, partial [Araneus ventricosus]
MSQRATHFQIPSIRNAADGTTLPHRLIAAEQMTFFNRSNTWLSQGDRSRL